MFGHTEVSWAGCPITGTVFSMHARAILGGSNMQQELRTEAQQYRKNQDDVLEKYCQLIEDYKRLESDYEEQRDSRGRYKQLAKGQEHNPYVLVLYRRASMYLLR